jgi:hypothetical protein
MDLPVISMERGAARKAFLEYRHEVQTRHRAEDEEIMRGYKWMSQGKQLIALTDAMRQGGVEPTTGLPRLAIARADAEWVHCQLRPNGAAVFSVERFPLRQNIAADKVHDLPQGTFDRSGIGQTWQTAQAMVPLIPPALRPAADFRNYHILFEAEWKRIPPKDPALLKHVGGDLYVVLATWDLTELERAVLGGIRRPLP